MKCRAPRAGDTVFSIPCSVERVAGKRVARMLNAAPMLALVLLLSACGGPRPASRPAVRDDAYYQRMITSGHGAFQRGDIGRAAELYENAFIRAQIMDRPAEVGSSAYNLALCRIALGDLEEGRDLLRAARIELRRAGESGVDTLIAEAEVTRKLGDVDAAWQLTDEAVQALEGVRARAVRLQVHSLRALMALEQNQPEKATEELTLAERHIRRDTALRLLARLAEVNGRLLLAGGETRLAAQEFDLETMYYRNEARFSDMARAMSRAASAYQEAGDHAVAVDRYYRAARHYAADGSPVEALRLVEKALPSLEGADDPEWAGRLTALFEKLTETVKIKGE